MSVDTLRSLRSAICSATGIEPQPFSSTSIQHLPAISYTYYIVGDNAVIADWRFEIRITAQSLDEVLEIEEKITDTLTTLGDEEKLGALKIEVSGGGSLEDEQTRLPQQFIFYDIRTRS